MSLIATTISTTILGSTKNLARDQHNIKDVNSLDSSAEIHQNDWPTGNWKSEAHCMLKGAVTRLTRFGIAGWAQDDARPDASINLLITDNGSRIGRVAADRRVPKPNQADGEIGLHGFDFTFPAMLSPAQFHLIRVRRDTDGAEVPGSPVKLPVSRSFDAEAQQVLASRLAQSHTDADLTRNIDFLVDQIEALAMKSPDAYSGIMAPQARDFLQRWRKSARPPADDTESTGDAPAPPLRALVMADRAPRSGHDSGSDALIGHMRSLQRIGYDLTFLPTAELGATTSDRASLDLIGTKYFFAPYYSSVEQALRSHAGEFDSEGDGVFYSFSAFDCISSFSSKFPMVHYMNTVQCEGISIYRGASHVMIFATKQ
jgi:hypothetical protein